MMPVTIVPSPMPAVADSRIGTGNGLKQGSDTESFGRVMERAETALREQECTQRPASREVNPSSERRESRGESTHDAETRSDGSPIGGEERPQGGDSRETTEPQSSIEDSDPTSDREAPASRTTDSAQTEAKATSVPQPIRAIPVTGKTVAEATVPGSGSTEIQSVPENVGRSVPSSVPFGQGDATQAQVRTVPANAKAQPVVLSAVSSDRAAEVPLDSTRQAVADRFVVTESRGLAPNVLLSSEGKAAAGSAQVLSEVPTVSMSDKAGTSVPLSLADFADRLSVRFVSDSTGTQKATSFAETAAQRNTLSLADAAVSQSATSAANSSSRPIVLPVTDPVQFDPLVAESARIAEREFVRPAIVSRGQIRFDVASARPVYAPASKVGSRDGAQATAPALAEAAVKSVGESLFIRPLTIDATTLEPTTARSDDGSQVQAKNAADQQDGVVQQKGEQPTEEEAERTRAAEQVRRAGSKPQATESVTVDRSAGARQTQPREVLFQDTLKETAQVQVKHAAQSESRQTAAMPYEREILQQVRDRLQSGIRHGGGKVSMTLHPESLGRLEIRIQVEQGAMKTVIVADDAAVREVLLHQQQDLKESLQQHGVSLDEFSVLLREEGGRGADYTGKEWSGDRGESSDDSRSVQSDPAVAQAPRRWVNPDAILDLIA